MKARRIFMSTVLAALAAVGVAGCAGGSDSTGADPTSETAASASNVEATPHEATPSQATTSPCLREDGNCLGALEPGDHASTQFAVFGAPEPDQFTYSVTDTSWANALDHAAGYWFQEAAAYEESNGDATLKGIYLFSDAAAAKQTYPDCTEQSDPSVPTGAASLIAWIRTLPDLETRPVPALVTASGAAPGIRIRAKEGAFGACYDGATVRTFVASRPGAVDPYVWGITGTELIEAHFLDVGDGHTVAILLYAPDGELSGEFMRSTRRLASTFTFSDPAG